MKTKILKKIRYEVARDYMVVFSKDKWLIKCGPETYLAETFETKEKAMKKVQRLWHEYAEKYLWKHGRKKYYW